MAQKPSQRNFALMGENLFRIVNKLVDNKRVCRLLKYQDTTPFAQDKPDIEGTDLLHKQIIIVPRIPENGIECSFIIVVFDQFTINPANPDFKVCRIRFDIVCPYSEWVVNDADSLRPYLLMQEIDTMFNQKELNGLGTLQFTHSTPLVLSPQMGGYSMYYQINEFN